MKNTKKRLTVLRQGLLLSLVLLFVPALPVFANDSARGNDIGVNETALPAGAIKNDPPEVEIPLRWQDTMIRPRTPMRRISGVYLRGVFPDITPAFGPGYTALNIHITDAASALIDNARQLRAASIEFSYEVFATHEVVSVVMYAQVAAITKRETVATINFHPETGALLRVECIMGDDFPALVERVLTEWTRENPDRYYAAVTTPLDAFYLTNDRLVFLFDEFQISAYGSDGRQTRLTRLAFQLEHLIRVRPIVPIETHIVRDMHNLILIPIKTVANYLGYFAVATESGIVRIWEDETHLRPVSELRYGQNQYAWGGGMPRALELPPLRHTIRGAETLMVPITFLDRVVPRATYHVDEAGLLHILAYRP